MHTPRVSVVIASYQHERFIKECLESALSQSHTDFEVVLTDDGSKDGTIAELRKFRDPRLSMEFFPENRGACTALNHSIRRARGEYIAVLNSDDAFLPEKLARQVAYLDEHPEIGAVFGHPVMVDEGGREVGGNYFRGAGNRGRHAWLRRFFEEGNCLCHPTLMIRRACYDHVGLYDARMAQLPDLDMWIRLTEHFEIHIMQEPLIRFRVLNGLKNASAARMDTIVRGAFEYRQILNRYARLPESELTAIFPELANAEDPPLMGLAKLAMTKDSSAHGNFGLDLMFSLMPREDESRDYRPLIELTGMGDVYGIRTAMLLQEKLRAAPKSTSSLSRFV
jgi:glycosyltransferase involved in cell wall biosynthesis